jgi:hypothetical protein
MREEADERRVDLWRDDFDCPPRRVSSAGALVRAPSKEPREGVSSVLRALLAGCALWAASGFAQAQVDVVVDFTGKTPLQAMQDAAASIRPYTALPQTDETRYVRWTGAMPAIPLDQMKRYGTRGLTRKGIVIAPVGALDARGLPEIDCSRNIARGSLVIELDNLNLGARLGSGSDYLSHLVSLSAGDVCGWADAADRSNAFMMGTLPSWLVVRGTAWINGGAGPSRWSGIRSPIPVAYPGHSPTTTVGLGLFGQLGADLSGLSLHINCGGKNDADNVGLVDIQSFSTALPLVRIGSCGTAAFQTGNGGRQWHAQSYMGNNRIGFALGNQLGCGAYVAEDCILGGDHCKGTRPAPFAGHCAEPPMPEVTIEGNDRNVVSVGTFRLGPGTYTEGAATTGDGGMLIQGAGFNSATLEVCCEPKPGTTCARPVEFNPAAGNIRVDGGQFSGEAHNVDFCFGPEANDGVADEVQFAFEGYAVGRASSFRGGNWPRAPTVDVSRWSSQGYWSNPAKPPGYTGRWLTVEECPAPVCEAPVCSEAIGPPPPTCPDPDTWKACDCNRDGSCTVADFLCVHAGIFAGD